MVRLARGVCEQARRKTDAFLKMEPPAAAPAATGWEWAPVKKEFLVTKRKREEPAAAAAAVAPASDGVPSAPAAAAETPAAPTATSTESTQPAQQPVCFQKVHALHVVTYRPLPLAKEIKEADQGVQTRS